MTIERAAKALHSSEGGFRSPDEWEDWIGGARAALDSIAEPTPRMVAAGVEAYNSWYPSAPAEPRILAIWSAMHRAMMKEKEDGYEK